MTLGYVYELWRAGNLGVICFKTKTKIAKCPTAVSGNFALWQMGMHCTLSVLNGNKSLVIIICIKRLMLHVVILKTNKQRWLGQKKRPICKRMCKRKINIQPPTV